MAVTILGREQTNKESTMEQYRVCITCKQSKPFSQYSKDKTRKHGISYRCKTCHAEVNKKYYDKSKMAAYANAYYHRNKEALNEKARAKRSANPEASREYKRIYYQLNKQRINKLSNAWRKENPEVGRRAKSKRRAAARNNLHNYYTIEQVIEKYGVICYLCNNEIDLTAPRWTAKQGWENGLHIDHVVRIADGGPDNLENVRPTHGYCNLKKH